MVIKWKEDLEEEEYTLQIHTFRTDIDNDMHKIHVHLIKQYY